MVKLSYTVALIVHHTNRSYKYDNYRTSGDGAGTVRDVIEPAVPIKKIMKELIFLFYGPVRQKKKGTSVHWESLPDDQSSPVSKDGFHGGEQSEKVEAEL